MSLPHRIHLVRHAISLGNVDRTVYATTPDHAVPLAEIGHGQAAIAGHSLRLALDGHEAWRKDWEVLVQNPTSLGVYLSPYVRTRQTWEAMAPALQPYTPQFVIEDARLREQEWSASLTSSAENNKAQTWEEAQRYGAFWYRHPSGESMADCLLRCQSFWADFWRDCEQQPMPSDVMIITHGFTLRLLLMAHFRWTVDQFYTVGTPLNCSRQVLSRTPSNRYQLVTALPVREPEASLVA